jgi:5-(carboxyamino)imidazole ribonucleotide mutase
MTSRQRTRERENILVSIVMGSSSDAERMEPARAILKEFGIAHEFLVLSAHRTPDEALRYAEGAAARGVEVIIAGAGGAAHLPGVLAAKTHLPVIGVPIVSRALNGLDSLLSIVQMPSGVPVATVAIDGALNAGLLAARILGVKYPGVAEQVRAYQEKMRKSVLAAKV